MKSYKNKKCWQAISQTAIRKGIVIDQKIDDSGWLLVQVKWHNNTFTWERVVNLSFNLHIIGQ